MLKRIPRGDTFTVLLRSGLALGGIRTNAEATFHVFSGWSFCNPSVFCTIEGNLFKIVALLDYLGEYRPRSVDVLGPRIHRIPRIEAINFLDPPYNLGKPSLTSSLIAVNLCMARISPSNISLRTVRYNCSTALACLSISGIMLSLRGSHLISF